VSDARAKSERYARENGASAAFSSPWRARVEFGRRILASMFAWQATVAGATQGATKAEAAEAQSARMTDFIT